jgi:hypothetical protein
VESSVYINDTQNPLGWILRFIGPYLVTFLGATIGGSLTSNPSQKLTYSFKSLLLFFIYTITPWYPSFYITRIFVLPFHAISFFLGYKFSFLISPFLIKIIKKMDYYKFIIKNKKAAPWIILILLLIICYPAILFGLNPSCVSYGNGEGWSLFGCCNPIYWENQRSCFNPIARTTLNEKYCNALNYGKDDCFANLARIKESPKPCINNMFYEYDDGRCIKQLTYKDTNPKICDVLLKDRTRVLGEDKEEEYDQCLRDLFDLKVFWDIYDESICKLMKLESNNDSCFKIIENQKDEKRDEKKKTLSLIRKYEQVIKNEKTFMNTVFNPPDRDFCRLLRIFSSKDSVFDEEFYTIDKDDHHSIVCFVHFGKTTMNPTIFIIDKKYDSKYDHSWIPLAGAGRAAKFNFNTASFERYGYYPTFEIGLGIVTYIENMTIPEYRREGYNLNEGIEIAKNLNYVNFCDRVKQYKKECKEIIES